MIELRSLIGLGTERQAAMTLALFSAALALVLAAPALLLALAA